MDTSSPILAVAVSEYTAGPSCPISMPCSAYLTPVGCVSILKPKAARTGRASKALRLHALDSTHTTRLGLNSSDCSARAVQAARKTHWRLVPKARTRLLTAGRSRAMHPQFSHRTLGKKRNPRCSIGHSGQSRASSKLPNYIAYVITQPKSV